MNLISNIDDIDATEFEIYLRPLMDDPTITELPFDFKYGNMPRQIYFNSKLGKIMGAKNACGWTFKGGGVNFTSKKLDPIQVQANVEQCYTVMLKTLFGDKLPDGFQMGELSPEIIDFMDTQRSYEFNRDLLSIVFLGDKAHTADDYYVLLDGVFTKLKAGAVANDGTVDAGDIVEGDLDPEDFFETMNAVYNKQSRALKNISDKLKTWIWTQALYDKYKNYLETATQGTAGLLQTNYVTEGLSPTMFKGIKILVLGIIDERLETDFLDGSPALPVDPYRCILTIGINHIILMDGTGFQQAMTWYEKKDDTVYMVGSALIDYQYGYGELNVVAGVS